MKKYCILASLLAIAVSCAVSETDQLTVNAPSFLACTEADDSMTKTGISVDAEGVGTIYWKPAEQINVFFGTTSVLYSSTNTEDAPTVEFESAAKIGSTELASSLKWGLYPYDSEAVCDGSSVTTIVPAVQQCVPGTFGTNLFPMVAATTDDELHFKNVCGGIKFSLSRDDIKSISFKGNNGEDLAGTARISLSGDGKPTASIVSGEKNITVSPESGNTFAKDTDYYIVMLPGVLTNGFTMTFETETEVGTFEYTAKAVEIKRSIFGKKEDIDTYAVFTKKTLPYLLFTADGEQTFYNSYMNSFGRFEYSLNGSDWERITKKITFGGPHGDLRIRGVNSGSYGTIVFGTSALVSCSGDIRALKDYTRYRTVQIGSDSFASLFSGCKVLISAPDLPFTELNDTGCYQNMFNGCSSLASAPELPATVLGTMCYSKMFSGCTTLTTAPVLPATKLAESCYYSMFEKCSSLKDAPDLPATMLASGCYNNMFAHCTSLVVAPKNIPAAEMSPYGCFQMFYGCTALQSVPSLPAEVLAEACYDAMFCNCTSLITPPTLPAQTMEASAYQYMFMGCTALKTAPQLPAKELATQCYDNMFNGCKILETAPELPATELKRLCYSGMFYDCPSLTTAPELAAKVLTDGCYSYMFALCKNLSYVKCLATSISAENCLDNWMLETPSTGTFIKSPDNNSWSSGASGIPSGWTIINDQS